MRRGAIAITALVCVLLSCGGLAWAVRNATFAPFVLPNAQNLRLRAESSGSTTLTYEFAGQPFEWRERVSRQLDQTGWVSQTYAFTSLRAVFVAKRYTRTRTVGPLVINEQAILGGDPATPTEAQITIHTEFRFRF